MAETNARKSGKTPPRQPHRRAPTSASKRKHRPKRAVPAQAPRVRVAQPGRNEGCSATLVVAERVGRRLDRVLSRVELPSGSTGGGGGSPLRRGRNAQSPIRQTELQARVCRTMFAFGHVLRMRIVRKLMDGPATYQALRGLTKLKPGPLYHHINQLRLAGLILPKQRDLYELTRAGRNMILGAMVLAPLTRDSRRRLTCE